MTVYIQKPVSEPPEEEGYYRTIGAEMVAYFHKNHCPAAYKKTYGWDERITHYLVPIEVDHLLTEEQLEEVKKKAVADWMENNKEFLNPKKSMLPNI